MNKTQLSQYKGKKVTFKVVDSFPDLKVQFVSCFGDYRVQLESNNSFSATIIKIKIVNSFPDVRLQQVSSCGDFKAYLS